MQSYQRYANGLITSGWRSCFSPIAVAFAVSGSGDSRENACSLSARGMEDASGEGSVPSHRSLAGATQVYLIKSAPRRRLRR